MDAVRTWTKVGEKHNRATVERAIENIEWRELRGTIEVPMMQGEGIKAAIRELRIPRVSHVAWSNELAPYGFYAIRGHYANGDAEVYIVDRGSDLIPVCSDFTERRQTENGIQ